MSLPLRSRLAMRIGARWLEFSEENEEFIQWLYRQMDDFENREAPNLNEQGVKGYGRKRDSSGRGQINE